MDDVPADSGLGDDKLEELKQFARDIASGKLFANDHTEVYRLPQIQNLYVSKCFACDEYGVWVGDRLVHPPIGTAPPANPDMPSEVMVDYDEASRILSLSPRGAAALLRLAIQRLCQALGASGDTLDANIGDLVRSRGLLPLAQQALDSVRVIGNESVHPGQLDLRDDTDTALKLFRLVNVIIEQTISAPKHVAEVYEMVPATKREAIAKRDKTP